MIRADRGLDIHEERIADQSCEDAHAILFQRFSDDEARLAPIGCDDVPFLNRASSGTSLKVTSIVCSAVPCATPPLDRVSGRSRNR